MVAVLGLTGGIGCGKSSVAHLLSQRGVAHLDADRLARDVVEPGTEGLAEVTAAFGTGVLLPDGSLDRAALARVVFGDADRRRLLESLLFPRIAQAAALRIGELAETGARIVAYEASLLVENGLHRGFADLIVVTAPLDVRIARVRRRDGASEDEVRARIAAQAPMARKVAAATWVVDNRGTPLELEARVAALYAQIVLAYGPPRDGTPLR